MKVEVGAKTAGRGWGAHGSARTRCAYLGVLGAEMPRLAPQHEGERPVHACAAAVPGKHLHAPQAHAAVVSAGLVAQGRAVSMMGRLRQPPSKGGQQRLERIRVFVKLGIRSMLSTSGVCESEMYNEPGRRERTEYARRRGRLG